MHLVIREPLHTFRRHALDAAAMAEPQNSSQSVDARVLRLCGGLTRNPYGDTYVSIGQAS